MLLTPDTIAKHLKSTYKTVPLFIVVNPDVESGKERFRSVLTIVQQAIEKCRPEEDIRSTRYLWWGTVYTLISGRKVVVHLEDLCADEAYYPLRPHSYTWVVRVHVDGHFEVEFTVYTDANGKTTKGGQAQRGMVSDSTHGDHSVLGAALMKYAEELAKDIDRGILGDDFKVLP